MYRQRSANVLARRTTLAVLALFIVGSIASSLHMALVRHAVCAEHGEVVHVAAVTDTAACKFVAHASHDVLWSSTPSSQGEDHDHCSVATQARVRDVAWAPVRVVVEKHSAPIARAFAPTLAREPAFSRLFLAPKHSPPA